MEIRYYDNLPEEAKTIRRAVFMEEQGFQEEFDEIDGQAGHLVMFDGALPVATCRFYRKEGTVSYIIGRVAVIPEYRGRNLGSGLRCGPRHFTRSRAIFRMGKQTMKRVVLIFGCVRKFRKTKKTKKIKKTG